MRRLVEASRVRILRLSVAGPGGLVESRPELHMELVMTTRGCSWIPLAIKRLIRSWRSPHRTPRNARATSPGPRQRHPFESGRTPFRVHNPVSMVRSSDATTGSKMRSTSRCKRVGSALRSPPVTASGLKRSTASKRRSSNRRCAWAKRGASPHRRPRGGPAARRAACDR